jgi:malonyl CoA-acyl carrier protein transacylase
MVDRYTKAVLTVIAIALCTIAWGSLKPSTQAQAQMRACTHDSPCVVGLMGHSLGESNALPVYLVKR